MTMSTQVDARGLSCPQPVLMTLDEIKKVQQGEIEVFVDTDTSRENISRAAESQGWQVKEIQEHGEGYKLILCKD
jgi:TusA-related sulfurtransferase